MNIEMKILNKDFYKEFQLPQYQTSGAAAMDLCCTKDITILPGGREMIPTGLAIHIQDDNIAGIILPRSGLGTKGLVLANTVGLIDSDYQGELKISAWNSNQLVTNRLKNEHNWTTNFIHLKAGDRIAQLMFIPIIKAQWNVVEEFADVTGRAQGGFGSTDGV